MYNIRVNLVYIAHSFNNITRAHLALSADYSGAFSNTAEGFAKITAPAYKGDLVAVLINIVEGVGGGEDFRLINIVNTKGFKDL